MMKYPEIAPILATIERRPHTQKPFVIALDGRSGTGKSTLSEAIAQATDALVIDQDDFYAGGALEEWQALSAEQKAGRVIDWRRVRAEALEPLLSGKVAVWHPFDWDVMEGLLPESVEAKPAPIIILEGVYSSRPELADLYDLSVLVQLDESVRMQRLEKREGNHLESPWQPLWQEAEEYYFSHIRPKTAFDIVVTRPRSNIVTEAYQNSNN